jgi:hypothetical protein
VGVAARGAAAQGAAQLVSVLTRRTGLGAEGRTGPPQSYRVAHGGHTRPYGCWKTSSGSEISAKGPLNSAFLDEGLTPHTLSLSHSVFGL